MKLKRKEKGRLVSLFFLLFLLFLGLESNTWAEPGRATDLVISEVQIAGTTTTDDFVEIYNPTDSNINLGSYASSYIRLVKRTQTATTNTSVKSWSGETGNVPAHGYYLWANSAWTPPVTPDATTTTTNAADTSLALEIGTTGTYVDQLAYGSGHTAPLIEGAAYATNPAANQSIERKAISTSTATTMASGNIDQTKGNGEDTNANSADFIYRTASDPQNSSSTREDPVTQLTYKTAEQTFAVNVVSAVYSVWSLDEGGYSCPLYTDAATINLSSLSTSELFYSDANAPWDAVTSITIASGVYEGVFYYKEPTTAGIYSITSAEESPGTYSRYWTDVKQTVTITGGAGAIDHYDVNEPTSATAGSNFTVTITPHDASNIATTGSATVTLSAETAAGVAGTGTLSSATYPTLVINTSAGAVTVTDLKYTKAESIKIKATDGTKSSTFADIANTIVVGAAAIDHYNIAEPTSATAGTNFTVTVTPHDANNNSTTGSATVTLSAETAAGVAGTGTLSSATYPTLVINTSAGAVTVTDLKYTKAESIKIKATDGTKSSTFADIANTIVVSAADKNKLLWVTQPATSVIAGQIWTTFTIEITDQYGNRTTDVDNVTVTPSSGSFGGTTTQAAVSGLASFTDITYGTAATITVTGSSGILTNTSAASVTVNAVTVVINEIGWDGDAEYIELYNNSGSPVTLNGWYLTDDLTTYTITTGSIAAGGYFLIESAAADTSATADLIDATLALVETDGELISLYDSGATLMDSANQTTGGWFAGWDGYYIAMERVSPTTSGTTASNWQNAIVRMNLDNNTITTAAGTPGAANTDISSFASSKKIVINEIMWDEGTIYLDEYIELRNTDPIDYVIGGWEIVAEGLTTAKEADMAWGSVIMRTPDTATYSDYFLVGDSDSTSGSNFSGIDRVDVLEINQTTEVIRLHYRKSNTYDWDGPDGIYGNADDSQIIDTASGAATGAAWCAGSLATTESDSMERKQPTPGDGTLSTNWVTAVHEGIYSGGRSHGTPGYKNDASSTTETKITITNWRELY